MDLFEELIGGEWNPAVLVEPPEPDAPVPGEDRIAGMMLGHALGDALGGPHEFRNQGPIDRYTGRLEHELTLFRRFQGGWHHGQVGQVTDDTEMSLALALAIVKKGKYSADAAATEYLAWVRSRPPFMGVNTRTLFGNLRTLDGYKRRRDAMAALPQATMSQSNGCLMRAAPLAVLRDCAAAAVADCALTNFHPICLSAVRAYVLAVRELLLGRSAAEATRAALDSAADNPEVTRVIERAEAQLPRVVADAQKGWVLHALHCAFWALNSELPGYRDRINLVVRLGGDTDTNAAIAGAMLGAQLGETQLRQEAVTCENLRILLAADSSLGELARPAVYSAARIPRLVASLSVVARAPE